MADPRIEALIGHSAGARLIDLTAKRLVNYYKTKEEEPFIHLTFLDAYTPFNAGKDTYGDLEGEGYPKDKHYSEHYIHYGLTFTDACLSNAFNFDITDWPALSVEDRQWKEKDNGHQWPIYWYKRSITASKLLKYGYYLSREGGYSEYKGLAEKYSKDKQCFLDSVDRNCERDKDECW